MWRAASSRRRSRAGRATSRAIPQPANALIKADNPKMSDEQIAFGIKRMNELQVVDGGDAKTMGIGIMTEARWKATYDLMVKEGLLPKDTDWTQGLHDAVRQRPQDHRAQ